MRSAVERDWLESARQVASKLTEPERKEFLAEAEEANLSQEIMEEIRTLLTHPYGLSSAAEPEEVA